MGMNESLRSGASSRARLTHLMFFAAGLALALAGPALAQSSRTPRGPAPSRAVAHPANALAASCVQCDLIYAVDCNFGLWTIDADAGSATFIGVTPDFMFDVAVTPDGRMFSIDSSANLWELDSCTAGGSIVKPGLAGNGLATLVAPAPFAPFGPARPRAAKSPRSSPSSTGGVAALYAQGPPLTRTTLDGTYTTTDVGGAIGAPTPPFWCGVSGGDLAQHPATGVVYSTLTCPDCAGDMLVTLSPSTGEVVSVIGCLVDTASVAMTAVYGLAFDSQGRLWGVQGDDLRAEILRIDPATAVATHVPISGGFACGNGFATNPCPGAPLKARRFNRAF